MTIEKLESRIQELRSLNSVDRERIEELDKEYVNAVNGFDVAKIDKLYVEIREIKSIVENRSRQISLLESPDNPIRVQARAEYAKKAEVTRDAVKAKADKLHDKLLKVQAKYIETVSEIFSINDEYNNVEREYREVSEEGKPFYARPYLIPHKYGVSIRTGRDGKDIYFQGGIHK